ncbi:MAG: HAD-IIA family hydrolase [Ardenticatenia bacterium]|nr:HAD-IIA family hydrolase [Ardenticatenia bacterium]
MDAELDGLLLDLDGVLVTGGHPLPGVIDVLVTLLSSGVPFRILSNTTLVPRRLIVERFRALGVSLSTDMVLTPPAAAARWLRAQGAQAVALFVAPPTREEFTGLPLVDEGVESGADFVVVGDMGDGWTASALNRALRLLVGGARLVALGMGRYWKAPDGLRLDTGAYVSALSFATGQDPVIIGKPAPAFFRLALESLGVPSTRVAMVGDDVISDVGAAQQVGLKGILVQTGKFRPEDLEREVTPDWVLPDVTHVLPLVGVKPSANQ